MRKNTAGQVIGAQMVSATDGSAFTGAVTCYVCGDGGTQAAGSVGSGACTHEGNGYHTYAPAQAETNYDLIAFTFTGSGAVPATVQVYTGYPQTGDSYARLGAPAGASVSADIANVPTVAEFEARTLPAADYTVVSDLPSVPSAADNATAAAAAILATPANKLATDASGRVTPDTVTPATDVSALALEATAQAILTDTGTTLPEAITSAAANVSVDEIQPTALADLFNTNSGTTHAAAVAGSPVKEIADNAGAGGVTVTASVQLSAAQANAVNSGDLAISTHHALAQTITSTSANALDARVLVLAVKVADTDADSASIVLISTDTGLEYLAGAAYATPAHGSLTVGGNAGAWTITATLDGAATALLTPYAVHSYPAELKDLTSDTAVWTGLALIGRGLVQMLS